MPDDETQLTTPDVPSGDTLAAVALVKTAKKASVWFKPCMIVLGVLTTLFSGCVALGVLLNAGQISRAQAANDAAHAAIVTRLARVEDRLDGRIGPRIAGIPKNGGAE